MTDKYITITNGLTYVFDKAGGTELQVPSIDFTNAYFGHDIGILPPAVRWISDTVPAAFILERPPHTREINYRKITYKISMPWTIFGIFFSSPTKIQIHAFCSMSKLNSFDDELFVLPLPMAQEDGLIEGFEYNIVLNSRRQLGPSLLQVIDKMFNTRTAKNFNKEVLPLSWVEMQDKNNREIIEHWQTYNAEQVFTDIEYYTSNTIPTVGRLAAKLEANPKSDSTFDYMTELLKEVKSIQG